ncbi:MAG: Gfo/Idh/MocA family oxidoreductase, partial [Gammaproteobacteria bacterium]|nr:Gfo/Idh/MocA family oxidoreductase [Gammaproteobacteria bacterium]
MIRVGIVGCGRIVEVGHAPAFEELDNRFEIVAVADPSKERRGLIGDRFGVPAESRYINWDDLFKDRNIDLIDMALPHFLHRDSCLAAAASGKPILMEKPMATSLEEADEIMAAVANSGAPACIVHNYLYSAESMKTLELLRTGSIGRPFLVRIEGLSDSHWPGVGAYDPDWRTRAKSSGGGALIDNAYHNLYSAAAYMGSRVTEVYARLGTFVRDIEVEDTVVVTLSHENGGTS